MRELNDDSVYCIYYQLLNDGEAETKVEQSMDFGQNIIPWLNTGIEIQKIIA